MMALVGLRSGTFSSCISRSSAILPFCPIHRLFSASLTVSLRLLPSLSVSYRLSPSPSSRAVANQFPPHQFQCYLRRAAATERFQCSFRAFSEHFQGSFRAVSGQFQSTFESSFQLSSKTSFNCLHPSFRTVSEQFQSKIQPPLSPGFERYPLGF